MKKITSLLIVLAIVLTMTMAVYVFAADYTDEAAANAANVAVGTKITVGGREYTAIDDASQITDMAGSYYLTKDITWPDKRLGDFSGSFNGGNHTITLSGDSMFGPVGGPTSFIGNFIIVGESIIYDDGVFGLVGSETHGGEFKNIHTYVEVLSPGDQLGGLFGTVSSTSRSDTLIVENCVNNGMIDANERAAGFLGHVGSISAMKNITFRNCVNNGLINSSKNYYSGGIIGSIQGTQADCTFNFENCVNNGDITAGQSFVGGIVGGIYKGGAVPTLNITGCTNNGSISSSVASSNYYGTGGIFGGIDQSSVNLNVSGCVNNGAVSAVDIAGGIVGGVSKIKADIPGVAVTVVNCVNTGSVTVSTDVSFCSAIANFMNHYAGSATSFKVSNCSSTVADLKLTDTRDALEDGTVLLVPEVTNTNVVTDINALLTAHNAIDADLKFTAEGTAVRVTMGTHTYADHFCTDCGAPDPYNPMTVGGSSGGDVTTPTETTPVKPPVTQAPTTEKPATGTEKTEEEEKGGCSGFATGSVAVISIVAVAGAAIVIKKKKD